jgi:hypothetical protein
MFSDTPLSPWLATPVDESFRKMKVDLGAKRLAAFLAVRPSLVINARLYELLPRLPDKPPTAWG